MQTLNETFSRQQSQLKRKAFQLPYHVKEAGAVMQPWQEGQDPEQVMIYSKPLPKMERFVNAMLRMQNVSKDVFSQHQQD